MSRRAWHLLSATEQLYVRTSRHPAVAELPPHLTLHSFDHIYDRADDFQSVYQQIAAEVLALGQRGDVVYAVPGDPFVGETTVTAIVAAAREAGVPLQTVPGVSFVEPVLAAAGIDALDGLQIHDAIGLAGYHYPPLSPDVPVLLGQVFSRMLAGELKLSLMALYPEEHEVVLIHRAGQADQVVERLLLYEIDRSDEIAHLTSLFIPPLPYKASLPALAETVAVLRSPEGCPWDQEQTSQSLRAGFLEEAYEALAAIDAEDVVNLREELGDLLYHIVMQAQIASESGDFTLADVVGGIEAKLKRRHPHVWGDWQVNNTAEVLRNWELLKHQEKAERQAAGGSVLDHIPVGLPALARSQKIQNKVAKLGFDWPAISGVYDKIREEIAEIQQATTPEEQRAELGDLLFIVVNLARWLDLDAESAMREANEKFSGRFRHVERLAAERGRDLAAMDFLELDALWQEAKALHGQASPPGAELTSE